MVRGLAAVSDRPKLQYPGVRDLELLCSESKSYEDEMEVSSVPSPIMKLESHNVTMHAQHQLGHIHCTLVLLQDMNMSSAKGIGH